MRIAIVALLLLYGCQTVQTPSQRNTESQSEPEVSVPENNRVLPDSLYEAGNDPVHYTLDKVTVIWQNIGIREESTILQSGEEIFALLLTDENFFKIAYLSDNDYLIGYTHRTNLPDSEMSPLIELFEAKKAQMEVERRNHDIERQKKLAEKREIRDSLITVADDLRRNSIWVTAERANFRSNNSTQSDIIRSLDQGDRIFVQKEVGDWYHCKLENTDFRGDKFKSVGNFNKAYIEGWVHKSVVSNERARPVSPVEKRRREYITNNPYLSEQHKNDILEGRIRIGMTKEMVLAARGNPIDINRTVTAYSVNEQWVYGRGRNRMYVYFEDGIMTAFQD